MQTLPLPRLPLTFTHFALVALVLAAASCSAPRAMDTPAPPAEPPVHRSIVLEDGRRIGGHVRAERVIVPEDAVVWIDAPLVLEVTGELDVRGTLRAMDGTEAAPHAPSIEIRGTQLVFVDGAILGGNGFDASVGEPEVQAGKAGGDGSSIAIDCEEYTITGRILAGYGGNGGPSGNGGKGGSISIRGEWFPDDAGAYRDAIVRAASGGMGGQGIDFVRDGRDFFDSGEGGDTGDLHFRSLRDE